MDILPDPICIFRRNASLNMARFYRVEIRKDLFGQTTLERTWGRIGGRGQSRLNSYPSTHSAEQAASKLGKADISRVLLLSDGGANKGLTDPSVIASHCAQMAGMGVGTSTYGLGRRFNEHLMQAMARSGGGNSYYGQTAADLMGPFQEELDLLQALYARDLHLDLSAGPGVDLSVANSLTSLDGCWRLPDVAYGSEAWALVRLRVPPSVVAAGERGEVLLLRASLAYTVEGRPQSAGPVSLRLPALPASSHGALAQDELVVRRAQEVRFAEFQEQASEAARAGNWDVVDRVLNEARSEAAGNEWLSASMSSLERYAALRDRERFSKEASFKSARIKSRIVEANESGHYGVASESEKATYLRRKREEGSTRG